MVVTLMYMAVPCMAVTCMIVALTCMVAACMAVNVIRCTGYSHDWFSPTLYDSSLVE